MKLRTTFQHFSSDFMQEFLAQRLRDTAAGQSKCSSGNQGVLSCRSQMGDTSFSSEAEAGDRDSSSSDLE